MPPIRPTFVLLNPAAGRGRGLRRRNAFLRLLEEQLGEFDHAETEHAGHEVSLTDAAIERGYAAIVAVGGDGTWSAVADRIVRSGRGDITLGLLPAGTGNDFGKSLGIREGTVRETIRGIASGNRRTIDVGRVEGRHFLNVVGVGFDIAVIDDAATFPVLKGDLLYRFCALRQLFRFPGIPLAVSDGSDRVESRDHLMLVIANANFFGGSFHIAPGASLGDGLIDAVSIYNAGPIARARLFSRVARGRHATDRRVAVRQAGRFRIECERRVRYEIDGEVHESIGKTLDVECVPHALSVFVPAD